jgi:hypothetical protein
MPISTRYSDTDPRALEVFIDLHRRMSASEKVAAVMEMNEMLLRLSLADVRKLYPKASEREVFLRMAARHLDRDLMIRAYGWHPDFGTTP